MRENEGYTIIATIFLGFMIGLAVGLCNATQIESNTPIDANKQMSIEIVGNDTTIHTIYIYKK